MPRSIQTQATASRKRRKDRILNVIIIILVIIALSLAGLFFWMQQDMSRSQDEADRIKDRVAETVTEDVGLVTETNDSHQKTDKDAWLTRRIDFAALKAINPDVDCWLAIPDTSIDQYVLQEPTPGVFSYEHQDIYHRYSIMGSLVTPRVDESDAHKMIFGHYVIGMLRTDLMFSALSSYYADKTTAERYRYAYVYYPDHAERWTISAAMDARATDRIYETPYEKDSEGYADMIQHVNDNARYVMTPLSVSEPSLMLTTCSWWTDATWGRFAVFYRLDASYEYETGIYTDEMGMAQRRQERKEKEDMEQKEDTEDAKGSQTADDQAGS